MASVTCAFFDGSAWGVTVTTTVFGFGAACGALYVAETVLTLPPVDCVVTTVNVPQEAPLHPGPLSDHASTLLGAEPGTGVSVATIVAVPPAGTPEGAESCSEKLLVIVAAVETCFEGSATLCAVSVMVADDGRICGAV
jgi:hypothetical protein